MAIISNSAAVPSEDLCFPIVFFTRDSFKIIPS
jgi:hypothetical protein